MQKKVHTVRNKDNQSTERPWLTMRLTCNLCKIVFDVFIKQRKQKLLK